MILITVNILPILEGQCHPIVDGLNNWNVHPILDDQYHPFSDVNLLVMQLLYRKKKVTKHPFLDENASFDRVIQKWMNVGRQ